MAACDERVCGGALHHTLTPLRHPIAPTRMPQPSVCHGFSPSAARAKTACGVSALCLPCLLSDGYEPMDSMLSAKPIFLYVYCLFSLLPCAGGAKRYAMPPIAAWCSSERHAALTASFLSLSLSLTSPASSQSFLTMGSPFTFLEPSPLWKHTKQCAVGDRRLESTALLCCGR